MCAPSVSGQDERSRVSERDPRLKPADPNYSGSMMLLSWVLGWLGAGSMVRADPWGPVLLLSGVVCACVGRSRFALGAWVGGWMGPALGGVLGIEGFVLSLGLTASALAARRRARAQAAHRRDLARELHDGVGAHLTGLMLQADVVAGLATAPACQSAARGIRIQAEDAVAELRMMLRRVRRRLELGVAIRTEAERLALRGGLELDFTERGDAPRSLSGALQGAIFRAAQEAVNNVVRHAAAERCAVTLDWERGSVHLVVQDDGRGFEVRGSVRDRHGLSELDAKAREYGGHLSVTSRPGQGVRLQVDWPLPRTFARWKSYVYKGGSEPGH